MQCSVWLCNRPCSIYATRLYFWLVIWGLCPYKVVLFVLYVLATFKAHQVTSPVISGWVPTCDSADSWQLYSAAPLGNQTTRTMTHYPIPSHPTQSHYPDTVRTSPCPILVMPSARLGSDMYTLLGHFFYSTGNRTPACEAQFIISAW